MAPQANTTTLLLPSSTVSELPDPTSTDLVFTSNSDPVYYTAVEVTNALSTASCVLVIFAFFYLRQKHPRLMNRTSLKLTLAMSFTDLVYHCSNLAGYGQLPDGFWCAFVGGWLFAFGSMLSLFYATAIALNTQLAFVHGRTPKDNKQLWFLIVPPIVAFLICTPALIAGVYGYDATFDYCWYETRGLDNHSVILRMVFTYNLWLCIALLYLVIAAALITWAMFNPRNPLAARPTQVKPNPQKTQIHSTTNANEALAATIARRDMARRALTLRLLGYILVPTISVISGMVLDLLGESKSGVSIPAAGTDVVSALAGLMGAMNAALFSFDPSVIAVVHALRLQRARRRREQAAQKHAGSGNSRGARNVVRQNPTPGPMMTGAVNTYGVQVLTTVERLEAGSDHSLEMEVRGNNYSGQHTDTETVVDGHRRSQSTIGGHIEDTVEMYHGL